MTSNQKNILELLKKYYFLSLEKFKKLEKDNPNNMFLKNQQKVFVEFSGRRGSVEIKDIATQLKLKEEDMKNDINYLIAKEYVDNSKEGSLIIKDKGIDAIAPWLERHENVLIGGLIGGVLGIIGSLLGVLFGVWLKK